ncbi:MAG: DUF655 domain-containing protein [Candidatus Woesearchaeota archaeon]
MERPKEEKAIVLDFLQHGYPFEKGDNFRKTPIAQGIGATFFVLLELVPKKDVFLQPYEEVYIGEGKREKIHHIRGKLPYSKLSATAESELEFMITDLVKKKEEKFVRFFNNSRPLTTRMHELQLLPGLGKKHMWELIEEKRAEPFRSFDDIKSRVKLMPEPVKIITRRIIQELKGGEKHNIFVDKDF